MNLYGTLWTVLCWTLVGGVVGHLLLMIGFLLFDAYAPPVRRPDYELLLPDRPATGDDARMQSWPIPDVSDWTPERFGEWVARQDWRFARSMPWLPHEYVHRDWADEFAEAVAFADAAGREALWPPKARHSLRSYYAFEDHLYWHMNLPGRSDLAGLFNRCEIDPETKRAPVPNNNVVWLDENPDLAEYAEKIRQAPPR